MWRLAQIQERFLQPLKKRTADAFRAVFLPAAGNRNGTSVNNAGSNGNYWSSSYNNSNNANNLNFNSGNLNTNNNNRNNGFSVRLVRQFRSTYRGMVLFFLFNCLLFNCLIVV